MSSIFLSHNHNDKPFVRRLAAMLKSEGITVWVDEAEIGVGESLLGKIETGIKEAKFVGAIISNNSINSTWVKRELEMAMTQEISSNKIKVLPIICEKCELPLYLQTKLNADFTDPKTFHFSFEKLINAITEQAPPLLLSAREALLEIKGQARGIGNLVGLSQQGINQYYGGDINSRRKDWSSADVKSGRSRTWVVEFFNDNKLEYNSFGVRDGKITHYPILNVSKDNSYKIQVVNFVLSDSVEIMNKAISFSAQRNNTLNSLRDIIILTRMFFDKQIGAFIWRIMFYDVVLVECIYALDYFAETGDFITEHTMKKEELNDFNSIAKQWIGELTKKGVLKEVDTDVILEMTKDYENRIENIILRELIDKLDEQNKLDDYEKIDGSNSAELWKYFNDNIPNFKSVVINAIANAKRRIIGNIDRL